MVMEPSRVVRELVAERDKLFSYIWSIVGDTHLAEDVLQEVSLLVLEKSVEVTNELQLRA